MVLEFDCTYMNEQNRRQTQTIKKLWKKSGGWGLFSYDFNLSPFKKYKNNFVEMENNTKDIIFEKKGCFNDIKFSF